MTEYSSFRPGETIRQWHIRTEVKPRRIRRRRLREYRQSLIPSVRVSLAYWWARYSTPF